MSMHSNFLTHPMLIPGKLYCIVPRESDVHPDIWKLVVLKRNENKNEFWALPWQYSRVQIIDRNTLPNDYLSAIFIESIIGLGGINQGDVFLYGDQFIGMSDYQVLVDNMMVAI